MKLFNFKKDKKGFTLIETLVAVFMLSLSLVALLSLTSINLFSAKYANNDITANYLLQEVADYIRNDRDSNVFQKYDPNIHNWVEFLAKYGHPFSGASSLCFSNNGCQIEVINNKTATIENCNSGDNIFGSDSQMHCNIFYYNENADNGNFYTYSDPGNGARSNFKRQIRMRLDENNPNILNIEVNVEWLNGTLVKSRTLRFSLINWQHPTT